MFRRLAFVFAFLVSIAPLRAIVWQSQEFGVAITLPDGADWVPVPESQGPTFRSLVGVINQKVNSMLMLTVLPPLAGKSYDDPAVAEYMKRDLTAAGYQIFGYSKTSAGTLPCIQFPVNNKASKGVVRVFVANGQAFSMTLLRGDGKNALEDVDLTRSGATFRVTGPAVPVPANAATGGLSPAPVAATTPAGKPDEASVPEVAEEAPGMNYKRIAIGSGILVFLLLMVWGIIGSGKK